MAWCVGKARLTAGAMLKHRYAWSTYAVLSSECSLEEKVRAGGAAWISGMAVRILVVVEEGAPIWPLFTLRQPDDICDREGLIRRAD